MNRFGQCCLLARRLIEAGVRFVTINTFLTVFDEITWDIHGSAPFTSIEGMKNIVAPMYDQAYSALIADLHDRGMLSKTMVCNLCEFGRTPRVNPAGGRDHWPQCYTVYFAGGGIKGGRAVGASDPIGAVPEDRPVGPAEVIATIFHSLGFDLEMELPGPGGRPFPLVNYGAKPIQELFWLTFECKPFSTNWAGLNTPMAISPGKTMNSHFFFTINTDDTVRNCQRNSVPGKRDGNFSSRQ